MVIEMFAAWLAGVKIRIAHSHNTICGNKKSDKLLRPAFYLFTNTRFACGEDAGKWLFGERRFEIINNGKDLTAFKFDEDNRTEMRKKLFLENKFVVGHVGSFNYQKNHEFLVAVFSEFLKVCPNAILFLMGEGELQQSTRLLVNSLDLQDKVVFAGQVNGVYNYLQAMDVMAFPSRFEGLPNVVVECQAMGLPCLLSDTITRKCRLTDLVDFAPIDKGHSSWVARLLEIKERRRERNQACIDAHAALKKAGFDINENATHLVGLYRKLSNRHKE